MLFEAHPSRQTLTSDPGLGVWGPGSVRFTILSTLPILLTNMLFSQKLYSWPVFLKFKFWDFSVGHEGPFISLHWALTPAEC